VLPESYVAAGKTGRRRLRKRLMGAAGALRSRLPRRVQAATPPSAGAGDYRHLVGRLRAAA
jgi:hypothetical protein